MSVGFEEKNQQNTSESFHEHSTDRLIYDNKLIIYFYFYRLNISHNKLIIVEVGCGQIDLA